MRARALAGALAAVMILTSVVCAQEGKAKPKRPRRRPPAAFKVVQDEPGLPRVLLIGDSISIGYTLPTRKLLQGKANVHRPIANCGPTTRGVAQVDAWLKDKRLGNGTWDVIHLNFGLHDLKFMKEGQRQVPIDQYEENLRTIVAKLKATGAKLIWASTTPVPEGDLKPKRLNEDVIAYNAAALRVMEENGVAVDDLYGLAMPQLEKIQRPVNVHFHTEGSNVLAQQVAEAIAKALAQK